jgi:predicted nucleotidyltransferase
MTLLSEILSSQVRAAVFQNLFDGNDQELHMRELERRSGCAIGTIQTEMKKLTRLDLVASRRDGNRLYFSANRKHPLYDVITSMVNKTVGIISQLKNGLMLSQDIYFAFVFGSYAAGQEKSQSDIDLMVVGNMSLRSLMPLMRKISDECGREINPHVMTAGEFRKRMDENEHFISNVMQSKKVFVKGGEDELTELAGQRLAAPS